MTSPARPMPGVGPASAHVAAMTSEIGTPRVPEMAAGLGSTDPYETTAELRWPLNLAVYEKMRRSDTQIGGTLRSVKMPPLGVDWKVERGTRIRPVVADTVEAELGLARDEEGRRRSLPGGVSWDEVLRHALLMLDFGHSPMEIWWQPGLSDVAGLEGRPAYHLRLSPRLPRSIWRIDVAAQGELLGIWQTVSNGGTTWMQRPIPRSSLVWFVNDREGADWSGKSILRSSYKNWMIKDGLLRTGALSVDRQGMGLPVVTYPDASAGGGNNASNKAEALAIATAVRTGEESGVALPTGWTIALVGVEGQTVDIMPQVNYHDQAVAKGALAMFMELGHDAGARSLGDTFFDIFMMSEQVLNRYVEEVFIQEVSKRIVEANFGVGEPYPAITADEPGADLTAVTLAGLANAGLLGDLSDGIVDFVRARYGMPSAKVLEQMPGGRPLVVPGVTLDPVTGLPVTAPTAPVPPPQLPGYRTPPAGPALVPHRVAAAAGTHPLDTAALTGRLERALGILQSLEQPTLVG